MSTLVPFQPKLATSGTNNNRPTGLSASKVSYLPVNNGQSQSLNSASQNPKFGAYIPVVCEVLCGVCCLLPVLLVGALALFGGKKKQATPAAK